MDYITRPATLNAVETRLLRSIQAAGWWSVDPKCLHHDDLEALEFLWRTGYIERAAYGGWRVKGNVQPAKPVTAADVRALLVAAGVEAGRIGKILPTMGAWKHPGNGVQYTVALNDSRGLMGANMSAFVDFITDDRLVIVRVKGE